MDIASCSHFNCLYISDLTNDTVHRIQLHPALEQTHWPVEGEPEGISVTDKFYVVVVCYKFNHIKEYSTSGVLTREVKLDSEIERPWHAISSSFIAGGKFLVGHGTSTGSLNRICAMESGNGSSCHSYGSKPGSELGQLNEPTHLAFDSHGNILIADHKNNRILVINRTLQMNQVLIPPEFGLKDPLKIFYDELNKRFYVVEYTSTHGTVVVYNLIVDLGDRFTSND